MADAPHIGFGPAYGQRIGDVSSLIRLIAQATGYDLDTVDQVTVATSCHDGDRLRLIFSDGRVCRGTWLRGRLRLENGAEYDMLSLAQHITQKSGRLEVA